MQTIGRACLRDAVRLALLAAGTCGAHGGRGDDAENEYGDQQERPVAVYQDDSYSSSINLASFPVFDLARVETLRGPQGTLFGRNATGGAIQFISNTPTEEFEGYANLTVGNYNAFIVDGAMSGPLSDALQ